MRMKRILFLALMLTMLVPQLMAQGKIDVTGTVTDEFNSPMAGVTVFEKGTTNGTVTDLNGVYHIKVGPDATLVFTSVGYSMQELKTEPGKPLNVALEENAQLLDDIVVVGYGVQKKSNVTGAISQVKAEDLEGRTATSITSAMQGKTSGVQVVTTSGAPGSSPAIRVRGYSSNSDMSPLYVVDGTRQSDIAGIDPNDIESIEVLKDGASAAIYGAQAGNGVVLITTKHGKKGKDNQGIVTYDFQFTSQSLAKMPKLLNSEQYLEYQIEGNLLQSVTEAYQLGWDGVTNTDWSDVAFESSVMTRHNLAVQGANDRGSYYLSLTLLNNDGIVTGNSDTYERWTAAINADYKIKPWLKAGTTNQIEYYESKSVAASGTYGNIMASVMQLDPLTPSTVSYENLPTNMLNMLNNGYTLLQDKNGDYYSISNFYDSEQIHPLILRDKSTSKTTGWNVNGSIFADFTPIKELTVTSRFGYRLSGYHTPGYTHKYYGSSSSSNSYISIYATTGNSIYYQWENFANFNKTFNGVHNVSAMIGMSYSKSKTDYTYGGASGNDDVGDAVQVDDVYGFGELSYAVTGSTLSVAGGETETAQLSYFGRLGYTYQDKYMAQFSLRADAYDLAYLPLTNRWGYFPAFSLGWDISKETFMESTRSWLSSLKLRYSWGKNGSIAALGGYAYSSDMSTYGLYAYSSSGSYDYIYGAAPSTMGNDDLEWETSTQNNIGIDSRLFRDRLTFSMDYFHKKTEGLLVSGVSPSLIVGGTASAMNAGDVVNKGFEFEIGWQDRIKDFSYSVKANLSTLSNEVTYLHPSITRLSGYYFSNVAVSAFEVGEEVWHFYGYKFSHIDQDTGEPVMVDVNGDGTISEDDKTDIGSGIPDVTFGITLSAQYKGFDFTVFGTGTAGNDIFMCLQMPDKLTSNRIKEVWYDGRWIAGADNTNATKPAASADLSYYLYSDAMVYDGSYFKIKQITLGYTLPSKITRKAHINNLRVYCSLEDFFTFTSYPGMDPEVSASTGSGQGLDLGGYPVSKKVVAGLNITF